MKDFILTPSNTIAEARAAATGDYRIIVQGKIFETNANSILARAIPEGIKRCQVIADQDFEPIIIPTLNGHYAMKPWEQKVNHWFSPTTWACQPVLLYYDKAYTDKPVFEFAKPKHFFSRSCKVSIDGKKITMDEESFALDNLNPGDEIFIRYVDKAGTVIDIITTVDQTVVDNNLNTILVMDDLGYESAFYTKALCQLNNVELLQPFEFMKARHDSAFERISGMYTNINPNDFQIHPDLGNTTYHNNWTGNPTQDLYFEGLHLIGGTGYHHGVEGAHYKNITWEKSQATTMQPDYSCRDFVYEYCNINDATEGIYPVASGSGFFDGLTIENCIFKDGNWKNPMRPRRDGHPVGPQNVRNGYIRYNQFYNINGSIALYNWHSGQDNIDNIIIEYNYLKNFNADLRPGSGASIRGIYIGGDFDQNAGTQTNIKIRCNVIDGVVRNYGNEKGHAIRIKVPTTGDSLTALECTDNYILNSDVGLQLDHTDEQSNFKVLRNTVINCNRNVDLGRATINRQTSLVNNLKDIEISQNRYDQSGTFAYGGVDYPWSQYHSLLTDLLNYADDEILLIDTSAALVEAQNLENEIKGISTLPTCEEKLLKAQTAIEGLEAQILTLQEEKQAIQADYNTASAQLINLQNQLIAITEEKRKLLTIIEQVKLAVEAA